MLVLALLRIVVLETFTVVSDSMEPTFSDGDRLVVLKTTRIERGDVIVFDGERLLGALELEGHPAGAALRRLLGADPSTAYVKRVIGVPGDRVACCDPQGRLTLNGSPVNESYLDGPTDQTTFDVTVPTDRYWVLGDNRGSSADSRSALGRPGGGLLRADDVIGEVGWRYWTARQSEAMDRAATHSGSRGRAAGPVRDTSRTTPLRPDRKEPAP